MKDYKGLLIPGQDFHVFNRAVGNEKLFYLTRDYRRFLDQFSKRTASICDILAFNLLPNHFHSVLRFHEDEALLEFFSRNRKGGCSQEQLPALLLQQFSNFENSHVKYFNLLYDRIGGLFAHPIRRIPTTDPEHLKYLIFYVHKNHIHHNYCPEMSGWDWSSYQDIRMRNSAIVNVDAVLTLFGGMRAFLDYHEQTVEPRKELEV